MVVNTSTIGQLDAITTLLSDDIFEIARNNGLSAHATSQQITAFVGSIPFQSLKFSKVTTPSDPPLEEGIVYLREIDSTNNGLFIKIKKAGVISEVQIV